MIESPVTSAACKTIARPSSESTASRWLGWALLGCSLAVVLYVRLRLLGSPLERDEGEYAYAGQLILGGVPPYKLVYNMKMPGIYLAYAGIMAVFGQTPTGIHLGLLVVHLASLLLVFLIARRFFGLSGAALATSAYAVMTLSPAMYGLSAHATHFVVLPELLGIWMLLCFEKSRRLRDSFASGCFFGIAFLMKQPGIFFGIFGGLYLIWLGLPRRSTNSAQTLQGWGADLAQELGSFTAGCILPFLAVCGWLKIAGVFPRFWFWTTSYGREYASSLTLSQGWQNARVSLLLLFKAAPVLWIIAALGLALLCVVRIELNRRIFLAGLLVFSFLAVCPSYRFREHYFIVWLPAVAMLIGFVVWWSEGRLKPYRWLGLLPLILGALACAESLRAYHEVLFSLSTTQASRVVYQGFFPESLDIGRYIEQNTQPNERVAVIGSEPQIYFYAHRRSSTGYIYMYPLMEPQRFAEEMQVDMIREIEQNPPAYLVFVSHPLSWLIRPESSPLLLNFIGDYIARNMQLAGLVQFTGPATTETVWGDEAAMTPLRSPLYILIFERTRDRDSHR